MPKPEPASWFAGDIHVHRSCDGSTPIPAEELIKRMDENDLAVISVLGDMGNSQAPDRIEDLNKINGKDEPESIPGRIIHYSAEWHWDADSHQSPHQALGGHIIILGPEKAQKIWDERVYKILEWSGQEGAIAGFAHMQYVNDRIPQKLNCCIPMDFPVEVALGTVDFISEDCSGSDSAMEAYYKLLNCGFRPGLAAGTDYPCNGGAPFGSLLTYVYIKDRQITYRKWIEGIKRGNTVVSRNGHNEFLELTVNDNSIPGDELKFRKKATVSINAKWTSVKELNGRVELVSNGKVIASQAGIVKPDQTVTLQINHTFTKSGWICARRMDEKGHQAHTAAVYISIGNQPVRASVGNAMYFVNWIDNILEKIGSGGEWSTFYTQNRDEMITRYHRARDIYSGIALEVQK